MAIKGPLSGTRVIDLSQGYGGPFASQIMADLGAEVIKVEPPIGEVARVDTWGKSGGPDFVALNRNKKGVVLDLWSESGRKALHDLAQISDVCLDSFRPGVMAEMGCDFAGLQRINPRIVAASLTGYGSSGPYRDRPPYEHIIEAMSGMASIACFPGEKPVVQPTALAEFTAGMYLYCGIMSALFERERTGSGRRVEVSQFDALLAVQSGFLQLFLFGGDPSPQGRGGTLVPVLGNYRARDGSYFAIGPSWPRITRVVGMEWLIDDPRFASETGRMLSKFQLSDLLEEGFQKADAAEWLELLRVEDIAASHINELDEVLEDPQVKENRAVISIEHPEYGKVRAIDCPIKVRGATSGQHSPPPTLGQHTEEVLKGLLGYSDERLGQLAREQEKNREEIARRMGQSI